jgi:hypothetical protein
MFCIKEAPPVTNFRSKLLSDNKVHRSEERVTPDCSGGSSGDLHGQVSGGDASDAPSEHEQGQDAAGGTR